MENFLGNDYAKYSDIRDARMPLMHGDHSLGVLLGVGNRLSAGIYDRILAVE